jgi:hypothetical protein
MGRHLHGKSPLTKRLGIVARKLATTFRDEEESRRSLEAMATLHQGRCSVADYFFCIEQLAHSAGINPEDSHHIILQVERGINPPLIN